MANQTGQYVALVLSLFPGIGLLDRAFEEEGFVVVRGPDLLWGGNIKKFHPPAGRFDGIIGGPPCQGFSRLVSIIRHNGYPLQENLIPEFERVVFEAQPAWWVMENVDRAPLPVVEGYQVHPSLLDNRWLGGEQSRLHRFAFGTRDGRQLHYQYAALENPTWEPRVCASDGGHRTPVKLLKGKAARKGSLNSRLGRRTFAESCVLQGLPADFFDGSPFTREAQYKMLGNGVPLPQGRELARAVLRALAPMELEHCG